MKLKEFVSYTFTSGKLDVYEHGKHVVSQPFNSDTGAPFKDVDAALAWLIVYFPDLFTPS